MTYEELAQLVRDVDSFAVVEKIESGGTPAEVAQRYHDLHLDAYWKHKDMEMVKLLATAGIHYCLGRAAGADPQTSAAMKAVAKGLAYNLGSFTWTGWQEPGLVLTRQDTRVGLDAARFNLRMARELNKPADKVRAAHWLLGAQLLAAGELEGALAEFQDAVPPEGTDRLFEGYVLLARLLMGDEFAGEAFEALLGALASRGEDEASKVALEQLATARREFGTKN